MGQSAQEFERRPRRAQEQPLAFLKGRHLDRHSALTGRARSILPHEDPACCISQANGQGIVQLVMVLPRKLAAEACNNQRDRTLW